MAKDTTKNDSSTGAESNASTKKNKQEEFFFSGGLEYIPMTIIASSLQEANEKYEKEKIKVGETLQVKTKDLE